MIIWFIGLSGSGKTTLARALHARLKPSHANLVLADGDILRDVWGDHPGHTVEGRELNARRISHLCKYLDDQGIHVIASVLSIFPAWQAWNRDTFSQYYEIFLDPPFETVVARDTKGLYARAQSGEEKNVVGVDIPFPRPANPDLVLDTSKPEDTPEALVERVLSTLPPF